MNFKLQEGDKVIVNGTLSVYVQGGSYQIYVKNLEKDGIGNLYLEFEKLKKKLENEGLFSPYSKKKLPKYPFKIGVATASSGAALRDIVSTIKRRWPLANIIVFDYFLYWVFFSFGVLVFDFLSSILEGLQARRGSFWQ